MRHGAKALTFLSSGFGGAQVELEINGASVYTGAAGDLSGKTMPLGDAEKVALALHFSGLKSPKESGTSEDARELGLFLESVVLQ